MSEETIRILNMVAEGKVSASEGEKLLDALKNDGKSGSLAEGGSPKKIPRFMYVKVLSENGDNVDVKVPVGLIRAGMKLTSLIPPQAVEQINKQMSEKGIAFDFNNLKNMEMEELIAYLGELEVNVNSKNGDNVKVWCE